MGPFFQGTYAALVTLVIIAVMRYFSLRMDDTKRMGENSELIYVATNIETARPPSKLSARVLFDVS